MICYLDSSVVLRIVLQQQLPLQEWQQIGQGISSRLLQLEGWRTIDRLRFVNGVTQEFIVECRLRFQDCLRRIGLLAFTEHLLRRAEQSFPTSLGSLDSLHLVSALAWRELHGTDFVFATHDSQLALAAKAHGFTVIGV